MVNEYYVKNNKTKTTDLVLRGNDQANSLTKLSPFTPNTRIKPLTVYL